MKKDGDIATFQYSKKYKKKLKSSVSIVVNLFCTLLFLLSFGIFLFRGLESGIVNSLSYSESSNIDYKVEYKNNNYFDEQDATNNQYIASLIKNIKLNFKYNLSASDLFNYKYTYYVEAKIQATERDNTNKILLTKKELLVDKQEVDKIASNSFSINQPIDIDYGYYNKLITNFKNDYTLSMNAKLIVTMFVEIKGKYSNIDKEISNKSQMQVSVPLSEQTIGIIITKDNLNNYVIEEAKGMNSICITFFIISGISLITMLVFAIRTMRSITLYYKSKSEYRKKLDKILKEYDRAIVTTKSLPNLKDTKLIEVTTFEEMLDARDNTEKSILFKEIKPNRTSVFILINNDVAFIYVLYNDEVSVKRV